MQAYACGRLEKPASAQRHISPPEWFDAGVWYGGGPGVGQSLTHIPCDMLQIRTNGVSISKQCENRIGELHGKRTTTDQMPEVRKTSVRMRAYTDLQHMRLLDTERDCENGFDRCRLNTVFPLRRICVCSCPGS